jgi:hypothetical protein
MDMDTEKFVTACESILDCFDGLSEQGQFEPSREPNKIRNCLWNQLSGFDEMTKEMVKTDEITFNKWVDVICRYAALAFSTGYCLGQMFDLLNKEALDEINTIKEAIKDKALLPYFPREKEERRIP